MTLPSDDHLHTQFSWDAITGDMEETCRRAVEFGLPAISFTEHVDLTSWSEPVGGWTYAEGVEGTFEHGQFLAAPFEVDAYLAELHRCRDLFPQITIRTGIELSEGHLHPDDVPDLLARAFDRVVGSVHSLPDLRITGQRLEIVDAYPQREAVDVVLEYLAEARAMIADDTRFDVLGHIDYPLRHWNSDPIPWDVFEEPVRETLRDLARSGRALEVNTSLPLDLRVVHWWHDMGGDAVAFGSDAHAPEALARRFREVSAAVADLGFRPADDPTALWARR